MILNLKNLAIIFYRCYGNKIIFSLCLCVSVVNLCLPLKFLEIDHPIETLQ